MRSDWIKPASRFLAATWWFSSRPICLQCSPLSPPHIFYLFLSRWMTSFGRTPLLRRFKWNALIRAQEAICLLNCSKDLKRVREKESERTIEKVVRENGVTLPCPTTGHQDAEFPYHSFFPEFFWITKWVAFHCSCSVFCLFLISGRCMCLWTSLFTFK